MYAPLVMHVCTYVLAQDKRLQRLKPLAASSAVWWRNPYAHLILVR